MKKTYKAGDTVRFYGSETQQPVFAGLFFYSGLGQGRYFSTDGSVNDVTTSEASQQARAEGVKFVNVDSFHAYQRVSVMG